MTTVASGTRTRRLVSLDAFRGLAVALMLLVNIPGQPSATPIWLRHAAWEGFTVADLVFPMFLLAVGMSIPLSRRAFSTAAMLRRVVVLFALGNLIVWIKYDQWWSLTTGVLQFIALSYAAGWLMLRLPGRWPAYSAVAVLTSLSLLLAWTGGWSADDNLASDVDRVWLGESTDLGLLAALGGGVVVVAGAYLTTAIRRSQEHRRRTILLAGMAATGLGLMLAAGVPVVKRLWTPSFVLLGIGLACLVLLLVDLAAGHGRRWTAPLVDIGMNPLAVYVSITLLDAIVLDDVGSDVVAALAPPLAASFVSVAWSLLVVVGVWLLAYALRRRGVFVRI